MMHKKTYIALAKLFMYPQKGYQNNVRQTTQLLEAHYPDAAVVFKRFANVVLKKSPEQIEEIFGVTFHIQAICYLDIGYVLFGEDYSRGSFLVNMKREQEKIGHDCGEELADNLPHVIMLLTKSQDSEFVHELTTNILIPAVAKMLKEFEVGKMALRQKVIKKKEKAIIMENVAEGNIYQNAIQTLLRVLHTDYPLEQHENELEFDATPVGLANICRGGCSFTNKKSIKI